jgi:hypothetical protein
MLNAKTPSPTAARKESGRLKFGRDLLQPRAVRADHVDIIIQIVGDIVPPAGGYRAGDGDGDAVHCTGKNGDAPRYGLILFISYKQNGSGAVVTPGNFYYPSRVRFHVR